MAITGDLFEKEADLEHEDLWTQFSENEQQQRESRRKVLRKADYIVPGHGKMFRNTKKWLRQTVAGGDRIEQLFFERKLW